MSDYNPKALANRKAKDRAKRKKLRNKLEAQGVDASTINAVIAQRQRSDRAARNEAERRRLDEYARRHNQATDAYKYDPDKDAGYYPDDTGYQPSPGDPLLRGPARVQGITAKVVRRGSTITEYQHDRMVEDHS